MEKNDNKSIVLKESGITLIALIVTVSVMIILLAISVTTGIDSVEKTKLQSFYTQLELIQKRVDDIASTNEGYYFNKDGNVEYIDLKTQAGSEITSGQNSFLQEILNSENITIEASEFRYFTIENLEEQLDLSEIKYNVFINFDTRTIIAENGIKIDDKTYYVLKNDLYFTEYNTNKNTGVINLNYNISNYGSNNYKITVIPTMIGDLDDTGILRYKETTSKYWETAEGLEIIISKLTQYDIEYIDNNKNIVSQTITLSLEDTGDLSITVN